MFFNTCKKCGHSWKTRGTGQSKKCPKCATALWYEHPEGTYFPDFTGDKIKTEVAMRYARIAALNLSNINRYDPDWEEAWDFIAKTIDNLKKEPKK